MTVAPVWGWAIVCLPETWGKAKAVNSRSTDLQLQDCLTD